MATWTRQPQEQEGSYFFSGKFLITRGINEGLSSEEILAIYQEIKQLVEEKEGLDYLQIFVNEKGDKLFFIDQLNQEMIESGDFLPEYNYCTLMFSHEY